MSTETKSVLTPEEWRQRAVQDVYPAPGAHSRHYDGADGEIGAICPAVYVRGDGSIGVDNSGGEYGCYELDARKLMALANLSLTLQEKPGALTRSHFDICHTAAWHLRNIARAASETPAVRDANLHAAKLAVELAQIIRAMLPPV